MTELKRYEIIYADPPWSYNAASIKGTSRGVAERYYKTMTLEEIKNFKINDFANQNGCTLFMWITMPHLNELKEILANWKFTYKTVAFVWIKKYKHTKTNVLACGYWTRSNAELCILATKGKNYPRRISKSVSQIIESEQREHSRKPDETYVRIEKLMGKNYNKIELFARHKREGWDVFGDEAPKEQQMIIK
jgi:N6-adenosine-specific RNA methylase IME4